MTTTRSTSAWARLSSAARRRPLLSAALALLVLLCLTLVATHAILQSETGRAQVARQLESLLSQPGKRGVTIGRIEGNLPATIRIDEITLADGRGPWLTVRGFALDWSPLALVRGRLEIDSLGAREVSISRRPVAAAAPGTGGPPAIPALNVTLKSLAVDRLQLDAPVLGAAATLRASANATAGADAVNIGLDISRTDDVAGHARAALGYDRRSASLDLRAELSEPAGGLTARLLSLPQLPALDLTVIGDGTAADWRGTVTLDAEELASLTSSLRVSVDGAGIGIALEGAMRPGAGLETVSPILGPETEFEVAATRPGPSDAWSITIGRMRSEAIDAEGAARLVLPDGRIEGRLRLATRDAARIAPLIAPLRFETAEIKARFNGPLTHPAVALEGELGGASFADWQTQRIVMDARIRPDGPIGETGAIQLDGQAVFSEPRGPLQELNAILGDKLRITIAQATLRGRQQLVVAQAAVAGAAARGEVSGDVTFETGRVSGKGVLELDDLSHLSDRAGRPLEGRLRTIYDILYEPAGALSLALDGVLSDGRFGVAAAESLLGPEVRLAGKLDRTAHDRWVLSDLSVRGADASGAGRVSISPKANDIEAEYRIEISNLAPLHLAGAEPPGGHLEIRGTATGPMRNPALAGTVLLADAAAAGFAVDRLTARFALPGVADGLKGGVELEVTADVIGDLSGQIDFALANSRLQLTPLRLTARGATLAGRLVIPLSGPPISGDIRIEAADLGTWSAVAGRQLAGRFQGQATLAADKTRQNVSLEGSVSGFALDGSLGSDRVSATARIADAFGEQQLAISLTSKTSQIGAMQLDTLALAIAGTVSRAEVTLRARGEYRGAMRLEAVGIVQRDQQRTVVTVARLAGEALGAPIALRKPALVEIGPELQAAAVDLELGGGTIGGALRKTARDVSIEAAVRDIPLVVVWPEAPAQAAQARIDADATLGGPAARPRGRLDLSLTGVALDELEAAPEGAAMRINAQLRNQVLSATGRIQGLGPVSTELAATIPVRVSLAPAAFQLAETAPISADIVYRGSISPLVGFAALDRHRAEGNADVRVQLSGSLRDPRITGHAHLTDGRYENLDTGTILTDIRIKARPTNDTIAIDEAVARDGGDGMVKVTGAVGFGGKSGISIVLDTTFENATLVRRDELTATSSGAIKLRGNAVERKISGRLDIQNAEIRLVSGISADLVRIEVEETGTPPTGLRPARPVPRSSRTRLDLTISMPKRVFVRGRGLESEWGGELRITGTAAAPILEGGLEPLRGRYNFLGKIFALRKGRIDFTGAEETDPTLDLSAERSTADITAIVRVTGTARQPIISLESIPELPQDEVLSRVLFNKSTGRLSALEAVQMAQALAAMTGVTEGGGIMDFGRNLLGLDVLEVKSTPESTEGAGDAQTSIEAGRYITEDVYFGIESGTAGEIGGTVEIEIAPRVTIEGDVGQKQKESIGIKWKRDY
ncbi:MAG: translocation/assembly module TamB domain-containing protein [Rhodospirillales bacterium]|nr:MAG: translocation/assembly module TamB domain-containing protein [Rhodospirillales bacterium]